MSMKHPEIAVKVAVQLKKNKIDFELNMAGDGVRLPKVKQMIDRYALGDAVHLLGNCPPNMVQQYMQESDIFLFTSDYGEGWGAVLSEAMAAGCVPIASSAAGASEILVKNGINGILYRKAVECAEAAVELARSPGKRRKMALAAYQTISENWIASNAAEQFCQFVRTGKYNTKEGPMCNAKLRKAKNYFGTGF